MRKPIPYSRISGMINQGKGPWLAGIGFDGSGPFITAGGTQPLVEAILFRVFKRLEDRRITPGIFEHATKLSQSELLLYGFLSCRPEVMKVIEYILSNPDPRRRKQLLQTLHDWEDRGEHDKDWEYISAFVKQENLPWFSPGNGVLNSAEKRYVARLIQAPHDETHLVAGPYLKPLMQCLKNCWHAENWIFYGSVEPEKLNKWLRKIEGCQTFFWSDYTAFDATFSEGTWKMIESFYHQIYPEMTDDFKKVLEIWRKPRGRMLLRRDGVRVEYDADVCNCSGRDDTALANALFNGIALSISFAAALSGVRPTAVTEEDLERASGICKISIVGDDSLVGCDFDVRPLQDNIVDNLKEFGLVVKAESSDGLHDVTFLGMMPYKTEAGLAWGPTIGRRLYKMFWMREFKSPSAWARGVSQQGLLLRNVPILHEVCVKVDELLKGKSITRERRDMNRPWHLFTEEQNHWDEVTLDWLCKRYSGLTKEMILSDIQIVRQIQRLPAMVRLESLEIIFQTEEL